MVDWADEQQGIRASQQGDHEAFAALIQRHQQMIHSLTFRMTGSNSDAEDLAQETFIAAYEQLAGFRGDARFSSWLYRIAVNLCLNWKKRIQRREQAHQDWGEQLETKRDGDGAAQNDAVSQRIHDALLKLHPKQRAAIILTTYEGFNHAEAARLLGCSETTVSWRLFAARAKLKRLLQDMAPPKGDRA